VLVHPSGKFLYGSNRGHDSIAAFAIDEQSGRLTLVQHEPTQGKIPRGFGIDPSGAYLIVGNQKSDSVVVFRIDKNTGKLTPTGKPITVGAPVSVEFVKKSYQLPVSSYQLPASSWRLPYLRITSAALTQPVAVAPCTLT